MRPVFDPDGNYMAHISSDYAASALARREIVEGEDGHLYIVPAPLTPLDEGTKRRIRLAKERKKR